MDAWRERQVLVSRRLRERRAQLGLTQHQGMMSRRWGIVAVVAALATVNAGCGDDSDSEQITLYTCASADAVQAIVNGFEDRHADVEVEVFRAPTGQLNARVAADQRGGDIKADVIWACDPLTMHNYQSQGLLRAWSPPNAADIPGEYRTDHFTGVHVLYMVLAVHKGVRTPTSWSELAEPALHGKVAIPSPTFAASALGLLGYFMSHKQFGPSFYKELKENGAVEVNAPTDTLTGVEQGIYDVGVTLANSAYVDKDKGSPIDVVWPAPGGVAIYGPVGVTTKKGETDLAEQFASFLTSPEGQKLIAEHDTYVTLPGVGGPPPGSRTVAPDWLSLFDDYETLLADYSAIFGS